MIDWNKLTEQDTRLIQRIARRAVKAAKDSGIPYDQESCEMDLGACHINGCPLDLNRLAKADAFNFCHDIFAIRRFMDRTTGKLTGEFWPRYALAQGDSDAA